MLATFRVHKTDNYFVCPNGFLQDKRISWRAKGILTYLLSKPDDWVVQVKDVVSHAAEGDRATRSAVQELLSCGYMTKRVIREDGKFARFEYDVFESAKLNPEYSQYLISEPFCGNGEMVDFDEQYHRMASKDCEAVGLQNSNPKMI